MFPSVRFIDSEGLHQSRHALRREESSIPRDILEPRSCRVISPVVKRVSPYGKYRCRDTGV